MRKVYLFVLLLATYVLHAQTYPMQNGTFSTCSGMFYDSGGVAGAYGPNESSQITFCPATPGNYVELNFSLFDVEGASLDNMTIYEGPDTSGAIIGIFGGSVSPITSCGSGTITSSHPSGCLTITFSSDATVEYTGWAAIISCTTTPGGTPPSGPPNAVCSGANPFCANAGPLEFPNISNADCVADAPGIITANTCLGTVPNPAWYYLEIDNSGDLVLEIKQSTGPNGTGSGLDVDYAIWGPYPDTSSACTSFTLGNVVDCSYSTAAIETATIPGAVTGQIYMVLITNFNGAPGFITMTQTNSGTGGAGSTDCTIVCPVAVGTNPSCGGSNGLITISGVDSGTSYNVTYLDDGLPVAVSLTSNASGQIVISGLNAGNYTSILTNFAGCNAAPSNVSLVSGTPPVFGSVTSNSPVCSGNNAIFTITGTPNTVVSYTINFGGTQTVALNGSGTATVTVSGVVANTTIKIQQISNLVTGCSTAVAATNVVTVKLLPTANINYAASPFCTSIPGTSPVTISGTGIFSGGTYSASPAGLAINSSSGAITPSASAPGNYTVTYTIAASGGCPVVTAMTNIAVTASTTAVISYPASSYCTSAPAQNVTLTGTGAYTSGTFSVSPAGLLVDNLTGTISPSGSLPGTYTITYFIPASGGCGNVTAVASSIIIANDATANISYPAPIFCTSEGPQAVTLTGTGAFTGGTYSSAPPGLTINAGSGTITPSSSLAGTYTVTYTLSAIGNCPPVVVTTEVTIVEVPTVSVAYPASSFCSSAGVQPAVLSGTGAFTGGAFTATPAGLTIDPVTGSITPATSSPGIYAVKYTVPSGGPCPPILAVVAITITGGVTANIAYGAATYCKGVTPEPVTLTGTGVFTGGVFSVSPAGLAINPATGTVTPTASLVGNYTITYTVSGGSGCSPVIATTTMALVDNTTASITYPSASFCNSSPVQNVSLSGTGSFSGGTFSASPAGLVIDSATGTITPSASSAGNYTITYSVPGIAGCGPATDTAAVAIVSASTAAINFSAGSYCTSDGLQSVSLTGSGNYTGGTYSASPAGLAIDPITGTITPSGSLAGNYTVTYNVASVNACPSLTATTAVTIAAPASVLLGYPAINYCTTAGVQNPVLTGTGSFLGGNFSSFPAGLNLSATTGAIVPATSATGNYIVTYLVPAIGGCPSVSATANVNITKEPTAFISYASATYCSGSPPENVILSGTGQYLGGIFTASAPGLTINGATGTITPSASLQGTYLVTYTIASNGGCPVVQATATVSIDEQPIASISFPSSGYCSNSAPVNIVMTGSGAFSGGTFSAVPAGLAIDSATGTITPASSIAGDYTVTYIVPANGICPSSAITTTVEISTVASANIAYPSADFCTSDASQAVTLTGTGSFSGGTYSASPAGLVIDSATGTVTPSGSAAGNYTITYSAPGSGGCSAVVATASLTISQAATATIAYSSAGFCTSSPDQTVALAGSGQFTGGTFSSTPPGLMIDPVTGTISPTASAAGNYSVAYLIPAIGSCMPVSVTTTVDISPAATATISYSAGAFCTSAFDQTATLSGTGSFSGGIYSSAPAGLVIDPTTGTISPSASAPGNYTITYSAAGSGGCSGVTASAPVSISATATAAIAYASAGFCTTAPNQIASVSGTGAFVGGTFSASPAGLAIDSVTGTISPSASAAGSYTISYLVLGIGGCGDVTAITTINISDVSTANIAYPAAGFCASDSDQTAALSGTGSFSGGTYSSAPAGLSIDPVTGTISPSASAPGNYTIAYSAAGSGGCSGVTASATVSISATATAAISYASAGFCTSAPDQIASVSGTGAFVGGTFSASPAGLAIDSVTGTISPSASAAGFYTISYLVLGIGGCGDFTAITTINISDISTANIAYPASGFCASDSDQTATLSGTGSFSGGTYSSAPVGLSIDPTTGTISPSASAPGNYTVTYLAAGSGGCGPVTATATIDIAIPASALLTYPIVDICPSSASQIPSLTGAGNFTGGTFSATPTGLAIDPLTGIISPGTSSLGSFTITYTIPASGNCPSTATSTKVNITADPVANIQYLSLYYCTSDPVQNVVLTGSGAFAGGTFAASPPGLAIDAVTGSITPSLSLAGNYTITYNASGSTGCGPISASTQVVIFEKATVAIGYSAVGFCTTDAAQPATLTGTGVFAGGVFSAAPPGLQIDPATGAITPSSSQPGNYQIMYTTPVNGTCSAVSATASVAITVAATATIAYQAAAFCTSSGAQPLLLGGTGPFLAGTYSAAPSGLSINPVSGQIQPGASLPGIYTVSYSLAANGSCGPVTAVTTVEIELLPTAAISYPATSYCTNLGAQAVLLTGSGAFSGGVFASSPTGLTLNAATGAITPSSSIPGTYLVSYTTPGGICGQITTSTTVSIVLPPTAAISYPQTSLCYSEPPQNVALSGTGNFTGGLFSATPAGLSINPVSGSIDPATSVEGNYIVTYATTASVGCSSAFATTSVTIFPRPTVVATPNSLAICSEETALIDLTGIPGTTFSWTAIQAGVTGAVNGSGNVISQLLSTLDQYPGIVVYMITPTANGCVGPPLQLVVTVFPLPFPHLKDGFICSDPVTGAFTSTYLLVSGLDASHNFQWYHDSVLLPGAVAESYQAALPGIYTVVATSAQGCVSLPVSAIVSPIVTGTQMSISGAIEFADVAHITVSVNGTGTYEYQLDQGPFSSSNSFTNLAPGLHTVTVRDAEGCTFLSDEFTVIGYPHYFTPNGDAFHDTWNIWSLSDQRLSRIHIFDRYGKLLKVISPQGDGWDGTYNGEPMPSTDYWFTVDYGLPSPYKIFKAHFALKR